MLANTLVTLSPYEVEIATFVGTLRQRDNEAKGRRDAYNFKGDPLLTHQRGAQAEMAVAKYLNKYWEGVWDVKSLDSIPGDVGRYQVRSLAQPGPMRLMKKDKPDQVYILVYRGDNGRFTLAGWCYGRDGMQEKYWKHWRGDSYAYFLPQDKLRPMEELVNV